RGSQQCRLGRVHSATRLPDAEAVRLAELHFPAYASLTMSDANPRLSWSSAFDAFAGGVGFILTTPRVWLYSAIPAAVMCLLLIGFPVLPIWGGPRFSDGFFGADRRTWGAIGYWIVPVLLALVFFLSGVLVSLLLAEPLSALALERIAQAQEQALTGTA